SFRVFGQTPAELESRQTMLEEAQKARDADDHERALSLAADSLQSRDSAIEEIDNRVQCALVHREGSAARTLSAGSGSVALLDRGPRVPGMDFRKFRMGNSGNLTACPDVPPHSTCSSIGRSRGKLGRGTRLT